MLPELLRLKVEKKFGKPIKFAKDCKNLSFYIEKELNHHFPDNKISHITLQRAFGIISNCGKPNDYTLDILARYAGLKDWKDAINKTRGLLESQLNNASVIISANLEKGQLINIVYYPERKLKLLYQGQSVYEVVEVNTGKLQMGDLLTILRIELNFELVCEKVIRNGSNYGQYISNSEGDGVVFLELEA